MLRIDEVHNSHLLCICNHDKSQNLKNKFWLPVYTTLLPRRSSNCRYSSIPYFPTTSSCRKSKNTADLSPLSNPYPKVPQSCPVFRYQKFPLFLLPLKTEYIKQGGSCNDHVCRKHGIRTYCKIRYYCS